MNDSLKHPTVATFLCAAIILLNTDLSCLNTYLYHYKAEQAHRLWEKRKYENSFKELQQSVKLSTQTTFVVRSEIFHNMATYVEEGPVDEKMKVIDRKPVMSNDVTCRGSPLARAP